jgi:hypothetical protein
MMLAELVTRLSLLLAKNGDMKVYVGDDKPENPLWRPTRAAIDVFCPNCGTDYCEINIEEAPDDYFEDNSCC